MFSPEAYIAHTMNNDYCIAIHRSTVHQVRESGIHRDQGTYLTIGWRREGMSNTAGRKWEMIYIHIFNNFNPENKETERNYGTSREFKPKI